MPARIGFGLVVSILVGLGAPRLTDAQPLRVAAEVQELADRLADAVPDTGTFRIAVFPITDGGRIATDITGQLREALRLSQGMGRIFVLVDATAIDRARESLSIPEPLNAHSALLVGVTIHADFVVVGQLTTEQGATDRLTVAVLDVGSRRQVRTGDARVVGGVRLQMATAAPTAFGPTSLSGQPVVTTARTRPSRMGRGLAIAGLLAASATTSGLAIARNHEVARSRERLMAIPVGELDAWNREYAHARAVERSRAWWWASAAASGGTGVACLLFGRGHRTDRAQLTPGFRVAPAWTLSVSPLSGVLLLHAF